MRAGVVATPKALVPLRHVVPLIAETVTAMLLLQRGQKYRPESLADHDDINQALKAKAVRGSLSLDLAVPMPGLAGWIAQDCSFLPRTASLTKPQSFFKRSPKKAHVRANGDILLVISEEAYRHLCWTRGVGAPPAEGDLSCGCSTCCTGLFADWGLDQQLRYCYAGYTLPQLLAHQKKVADQNYSPLFPVKDKENAPTSFDGLSFTYHYADGGKRLLKIRHRTHSAKPGSWNIWCVRPAIETPKGRHRFSPSRDSLSRPKVVKKIKGRRAGSWLIPDVGECTEPIDVYRGGEWLGTFDPPYWWLADEGFRGSSVSGQGTRESGQVIVPFELRKILGALHLACKKCRPAIRAALNAGKLYSLKVETRLADCVGARPLEVLPLKKEMSSSAWLKKHAKQTSAMSEVASLTGHLSQMTKEKWFVQSAEYQAVPYKVLPA